MEIEIDKHELCQQRLSDIETFFEGQTEGSVVLILRVNDRVMPVGGCTTLNETLTAYSTLAQYAHDMFVSSFSRSEQDVNEVAQSPEELLQGGESKLVGAVVDEGGKS